MNKLYETVKFNEEEAKYLIDFYYSIPIPPKVERRSRIVEKSFLGFKSPMAEEYDHFDEIDTKFSGFYEYRFHHNNGATCSVYSDFCWELNAIVCRLKHCVRSFHLPSKLSYLIESFLTIGELHE